MKTSAMKAAKSVPKCGTFMGIKGVQLDQVSYEFSQEEDTNQDGDLGQSIKVFTQDSGGGCYIVIETERWAMDHDDIGKFCDALKKIVNIPEEYGK